MPSNNSSLAPRLLYRFHFLPLHVPFVLHVHRVIRGATVTLLTNLVFLSHPFISVFNIVVLLFHELPPLDISLHLGNSARLNQALFLNLVLMTLFSIVWGEVFRKAIHWAHKVWRCWIWVVHFCVVNEFLIPSNVLSCSHLVQELFIYLWVRVEVNCRSLL